ncbi:hypothetical protein SLNSH_14645 [Alsobacter soli]|uniref:Flagellar assembly protein FliH/Type III secretion system HrpE domain-containing protein n=1 Tax=Alsobacter soli TaxID=2109933 RepID=A0A2T1HRT8_9HYPH|nr:hypothetical protein [Alsobacter soli]PSC04229.1 hypothetical protein SLNSH_14645 [Alsobacter soli]
MGVIRKANVALLDEASHRKQREEEAAAAVNASLEEERERARREGFESGLADCRELFLSELQGLAFEIESASNGLRDTVLQLVTQALRKIVGSPPPELVNSAVEAAVRELGHGERTAITVSKERHSAVQAAFAGRDDVVVQVDDWLSGDDMILSTPFGRHFVGLSQQIERVIEQIGGPARHGEAS